MSKKVALMCGHGTSVDGSWDPGCSYAGYTEAGLMLPITKAAVKYLRSYDVTVISDADNNNNKNMIADVRWANKEKCDIYVSVHCDYSKAPSGVMPLYVSAGGKKLAKALNKAVKSNMEMSSRGVIKRTDLWELNGTDMVACILETGAIKADLKILKKKPDSYGKAIAKGICNYLGVEIPKKVSKPAATPQPQPVEKPKETPELYRVRHKWNEPSTQVGAFHDLEHAKECADVNHLNVYGKNGKLIYKGKKEMKKAAKELLDACEDQIKTMKHTEYEWEKYPTAESIKKKASCVSWVSVALQRIGALKPGEAIWHNGKGYGTGKVYIWGKKGRRSVNDKDPFKVIYMDNKPLKELKNKLQPGDTVFLDDNKSGEKGSGGHTFTFTGEWKGDDPYIWDMEPKRKCIKEQAPRLYSGNRKVLAIARLK